MELEVDHVTYYVEKLPSERTNSRLWFMIKFFPVSDHQYMSVKNLSLYWYYNKMYNCQYSAHIDKKINLL